MSDENLAHAAGHDRGHEEGHDDSGHDDEHILIKKRKAHGNEEVAGLNLTAMMDVLTILLVYLIKAYAESPESITLNDNLRPPESTAPDAIQPAVTVLISNSAINVDNKKVLTIEDNNVKSDDPKNAYAPLAEALNKRRETIEAIAIQGGPKFDGKVMVVAHEDTPYSVVSNVLNIAGRANYVHYRLVVKKKLALAAQ